MEIQKAVQYKWDTGTKEWVIFLNSENRGFMLPSSTQIIAVQ